jgi:SAM-dependent methyltransferase
MSQPIDEVRAVEERYARRLASFDHRYNLLNPAAWQALQERQRALLRLFVERDWRSLEGLLLTEVGCGSGANLLELLRVGFAPEHLTGIELLEERLVSARRFLPATLRLIAGDALHADVQPGSQDVVYQSVVFSSLLDDAFQQQLADRMWSWLRPGGGVLWYDFVYDNPSNPDVRAVPLRRVRELFPRGRVEARRVTLAPPIARRVTAVHPTLYTLFNALPLLRTHLLAWIAKPMDITTLEEAAS